MAIHSPTFPDDHNTQPDHIDASTSKYFFYYLSITYPFCFLCLVLPNDDDAQPSPFPWC